MRGIRQVSAMPLDGRPYQPRVWIDRSGNKLGVVAESKKWAEAIEKLDFIVHMYMYPTSFSVYADISSSGTGVAGDKYDRGNMQSAVCTSGSDTPVGDDGMKRCSVETGAQMCRAWS